MLSCETMTGSLVSPSVDRETVGRKNSKESIHSGHFMVSDFEAEAQDEEGLEVPDQQEIAQPLQEIKGVQSIKQGDVITYAKPTNSRNDKTTVSIDASLTKLFTTMSIAYRQKITSPKWNCFKGLKLRWKDKIRLNNVIWRCWHMQFILKKKMTVCPFALDVDIHNKPETTLLEGKYWKRRIEAVTAEYKKWRLFYKNRHAGIVMNCDTTDMLSRSLPRKDRELGNEKSFFGLGEMDWARSFFGNQVGEGELAELDFMDVLLASPQPFHFPNPREIARGTENSDLLQPGLIQLQPYFSDDVVDFHEMLARDLPTVPEEDFFPDVEPALLPPSPPSPSISTPQPQIEYTARLTATQFPCTNSPTPNQHLDFSNEPFLLQRHSPNQDPTFPTDSATLSHQLDLAQTNTIPLSPPSDKNKSSNLRQDQLRVIGRSRSQQELDTPRGSSPLRQEPSQFAVPKPYTRRRSHSGSVGSFGSFGPSVNIEHQQILNTLSVPSLPSAISTGLQIGPGSTQGISQGPVFARRSCQSDTQTHTSYSKSALLAHLLTTDSPTCSIKPQPAASTALDNKVKLSLFFPPPPECMVVNVNSSNSSLSSSSSSSCSVPSLCAVTTKQLMTPIQQPLLLPSVTLSAVTPSSMKSVHSFPNVASWSASSNNPQCSAINLKTSPPHPEPSPPLCSISSPQNKLFRPKNDVERVQYKEHRRKCHITAEQKRRCNIKSNFDILHSLIPSVSHNQNSKVSKATMLHKGAEYIQQLKVERQQLLEKAENLKNETEKLNSDISTAQSLLPATGAPLSHTRHNKLKEKFENYVRERTLRNWKFWIFSLVAEPLLESFSSSVSTSSVDDLCRSSMAWLDQHCSLNVLRPVVSNSMRRLSTTTSILNAPEFLPEEVSRFVTKQEPNNRAICAITQDSPFPS